MNLQISYGVSPQYIGSIENGEHCLSIEKIILLSEKANISTDYILLGKTNVIDENMIKEAMNISQDQLDACFNIIKGIIKLLKNDF